MADKNKLTVRILILIIALLALAVLYAFVVRPTVTGYVTGAYQQGLQQGYIQAQSDFLTNIHTQLQQAGNAQIPVGENQVLVIEGRSQIFQTQPVQ